MVIRGAWNNSYCHQMLYMFLPVRNINSYCNHYSLLVISDLLTGLGHINMVDPSL